MPTLQTHGGIILPRRSHVFCLLTYVFDPVGTDPTKQANLVIDADGNGQTTVGDTIEYRIEIFSLAQFDFLLFSTDPFFQLIVMDELPDEVTYVEDTTEYQLFYQNLTFAGEGSIEDSQVEPKFALNPNNGGWPNVTEANGLAIPSFGRLVITYSATINADALDTGDLTSEGCKFFTNNGNVSVLCKVSLCESVLRWSIFVAGAHNITSYKMCIVHFSLNALICFLR